jgi:Fur family peroxide stress response transcriptional regulator
LPAVKTARHGVDYDETIRGGALRDTPQRRHVYDLLVSKRDHPTATEVFIRAKKSMPSISLATVYNSLETLVAAGLVKQVHVDREPTRYCPNLEEHGHFVCDTCGEVVDIALPAEHTRQWSLPEGFTVTHHEISLRGTCAHCAADASPDASEQNPKSKI